MPDLHPELAAEQRYVDRAYEHLDAMREAARRVARGYSEVGRGGTHQARLERDVADRPHPPPPRRPRHRRSAPLLRASRPAAATRPTTSGGSRSPTPTRTRSSSTGARRSPSPSTGRPPSSRWTSCGAATSSPAPPKAGCWSGSTTRSSTRTRPTAAKLAVIGEGALLAALERARTGRMGDIVATIQAEQDEAIRAGSAGCARGDAAAPEPARRPSRSTARPTCCTRTGAASRPAACCSSGPNTIFLRYIDQVLPSLGEDDVQLATPAGLKPKYRVVADDTPEVASIKGDVRMAEVIANALRDREHPLARDTVLVLDGEVLRIAARRRRRASSSAPAAGAARTTRSVRESCARWWSICASSTGARSARAAPDDPEWDRELDGRIRRTPEVRAALDRMWPVLDGGELVHDLFCSPRSCDPRPRASSPTTSSSTSCDRGPPTCAMCLDRSRPRARRRSRRAARVRPRRLAADAGGLAGAAATTTAARVVADLGVGGFVDRRRGRARGTAGSPRRPTKAKIRAPSRTCSSTKPRISRPCSGACSLGAARPGR